MTVRKAERKVLKYRLNYNNNNFLMLFDMPTKITWVRLPFVLVIIIIIQIRKVFLPLPRLFHFNCFITFGFTNLPRRLIQLRIIFQFNSKTPIFTFISMSWLFMKKDDTVINFHIYCLSFELTGGCLHYFITIIICYSKKSFVLVINSQLYTSSRVFFVFLFFVYVLFHPFFHYTNIIIK